MIEKLSDRLTGSLPGREAQFEMAPALRKHFQPPPPSAKIACVMALFFRKKDDWQLVLIERVNNNPNDRHGGQISFPGGKLDAGDKSLEAAAIREAEEEIGVSRDEIQILGQLTDLYIPVSNFQVHPFVAFTSEVPTFVPQESEVKSVLEVPFSHFHQQENRAVTDIPVSANMILREVPYFDVDGRIVWGATAMILSELVAITK